ncbi:MAG: hypothetical protein OXT67_05750 [Zetaproteobacteria bacterium]|nr:hypothetical protein [Zetaproteobacteria bacterium]
MMKLCRKDKRTPQLEIASTILSWTYKISVVSLLLYTPVSAETERSLFERRRPSVTGAEEIGLQTIIENDYQFLKEHPTNMLSAAQNIYAMIMKGGVDQVRTFRTTEPVTAYKSLSTPQAENKGRMIVGQYEPIASLVAAIKSQATGNRSGSKVPLLVGTHGTGKSEFAQVMANIMEHYSKNDPEYYYHEIVWRMDQLKEIPLFEKYYSHRGESRMPSPLHASPVSLLPEEYQNEIIQVANDYLSEKGWDFSASMMLLDPLSARIREEILLHYASAQEDPQVSQFLQSIGYQAHPGETVRQFTPQEELTILSKFAYARRIVMDSQETMPIIDAQGDEPRYSELFMSTDPLINFLSGNPSNPLSKVYNGQILKGSRNLVFFDELFRNSEQFRNILLGVLESRRIAYGSGAAVPFDAVILAASNTSSINKVSKDADSHAQLDRMISIPFEWPTEPNDIARIMIYLSKAKNFKAQVLGNESETPKDFKGDLNDLFPPVNVYNMDPHSVFPSGKYRLYFGKSIDDPNAVVVMPHTLEFMAQFIAATRMKTDPQEALKLGGAEQIINRDIFCNPIDRIKYFTHKKTGIPDSAQIDLCRITKRLKEGSTGLGARASGDWLTASIQEAQKPENKNTLTPIIARKVLIGFADDHRVGQNIGEFQEWGLLMDQVLRSILIPTLQEDFYLALNGGARTEEIYDEIMAEMLEINRNPDASMFVTRNNVETRIDRARLAEIAKKFEEQKGMKLNFQHLSDFHIRQIRNMSRGASPIIKNQDLLGAISAYLAEAAGKQVSLNEILQDVQREGSYHSNSPSGLPGIGARLFKLGYNEHSTTVLIEILKMEQDRLRAKK